MGLAIPLTALANVPCILLRAQLRFRDLAMVGGAEVVGVQVLTVAFAAARMGPYSFVLPLPIVALIRTAALWLMTRPPIGRPRLARVRQDPGPWQPSAGHEGGHRRRFPGRLLRPGPLHFEGRRGRLLLRLSPGRAAAAAAGHQRDQRGVPGTGANGKRSGPPAGCRAGRRTRLPMSRCPAAFCRRRWRRRCCGSCGTNGMPRSRLRRCSASTCVRCGLLHCRCRLAARGEFFSTFKYIGLCAVGLLRAVVTGAAAGTNKALTVALAVAVYYAAVTPLYSVFAFRKLGSPLPEVLGIAPAPRFWPESPSRPGSAAGHCGVRPPVNRRRSRCWFPASLPRRSAAVRERRPGDHPPVPEVGRCPTDGGGRGDGAPTRALLKLPGGVPAHPSPGPLVYGELLRFPRRHPPGRPATACQES